MSGWSVILTTLFLGKPYGHSIPVLGLLSFAINCQLLFLNQRKRKNGNRKDVQDTGINAGTACIPSGSATDCATAFWNDPKFSDTEAWENSSALEEKKSDQDLYCLPFYLTFLLKFYAD